MLYFALALVSYSIFVFVSESFSPFANVKSPVKRRRMILGRKAGLAVLIIGVAVHFVGSLCGVSLVLQLGAFFGLSVFVILLVAVQIGKRNRHAISLR